MRDRRQLFADMHQRERHVQVRMRTGLSEGSTRPHQVQGHGRTRVPVVLHATQHPENFTGPSRNVGHHQQHEIGDRHRFRVPHRHDILGRRVRKENIQVIINVTLIYSKLFEKKKYLKN